MTWDNGRLTELAAPGGVWSPTGTLNEHLAEVRGWLGDPDARPYQVITPILYIEPRYQHIGWDLASAWLKEKRVRLDIGSTGNGWFTLAVFWMPEGRRGPARFDFRISHTLSHSPERVAAQLLNFRITSGLPAWCLAHKVDPNNPGRQPWLSVGRMERLTPFQVAWNDARYPSRDLPWKIHSFISASKVLRDGYPFNHLMFRRRKEDGKIDCVQFKGELGWFPDEIRPRVEEVVLDYSAYLDPLRTSPPWV